MSMRRDAEKLIASFESGDVTEKDLRRATLQTMVRVYIQSYELGMIELACDFDEVLREFDTNRILRPTAKEMFIECLRSVKTGDERERDGEKR